MDCYCDYDPPEWSRADIVRARKVHRCEECRGVIRAGEKYEYAVGKFEGDIYQSRTCELCVNLRVWVRNNVPCLCWAHGNADDDMANAIAEATFRAPAETTGLHFGFLRRKVLRDRHNAARRAEAAMGGE